MQPSVFIEYSFLEKFILEIKKPYYEINGQYICFIDILIREKSTIYIDIDINDFYNIIKQSNNSINACYLRNLSLVNKIRFTEKKISQFISDYNLINKLKNKPHYILADINTEKAESLTKALGIIFLGSDFNNAKIYFLDSIIKPLPIHKKIFFSKIFTSLPQPKDVIIEDPYFFKQSISFLEDFICGFLNNEMKRCPVKILIITALNSEEEKQNLNNLKNLISNIEELRIEITCRPMKEIHDRHVYSNTYWISSLSSFREEYTKKTVIDIHPIGLYYSQFYEKITDHLKKYIKEGGTLNFEIVNLN